jgi:hypothetical protein
MDLTEMLAAAVAALARAEEKAAASEAARLSAEEKAAASEAARLSAEEKAAASEAARLSAEETLVVESKRTRLFSPTKFSSIEDWLNVQCGSDIPAIEDVGQFLSSYKNSSSLDTSISYEDDSSCSGSRWTDDKLPMNRFRRNMTNALTSSKMRVRILDLNDEAIMCLVSKRVFENDKEATESLVDELSVIVAKIRETLYFQDQRGQNCPEVTLVQPLFALFVEHIMTRVLPQGRVGLGQLVSLKGAVLVPSPTAPPATKTLSGNADLLFFKSDDIGDDIGKPLDNLQCVCELKSPFKKLSHGGAHASKDQLLAELEGCGQMTGGAHHIMGLLSDFFVAGVVIRAPSTADCDYPIFYQALRVTDTTSFVLRLLFVLLDLGAVDFEELLRNCKTEIAVPADDESGTAEGESAAAGQHLPPGTESAASRRQEVVTKEPNAKSNKLYLAAVHKEEVQIAIERDYARRGLAYLSEDELNKRNFAYGPVKRDVSALL